MQPAHQRARHKALWHLHQHRVAHICTAEPDAAADASASAAPAQPPGDAPDKDSPATPRSDAQGGITYTYKSDGHYKATIEDVFGGIDEGQLQGSAPWAMGWQANEKTIKWNDDLKRRLLIVRPSCAQTRVLLKHLHPWHSRDGGASWVSIGFCV